MKYRTVRMVIAPKRMGVKSLTTQAALARFSTCAFVLLVLSLRTFAQTPATPNGQQLFSSHCAACHGLDGRGGEHAPNIATSAPVQQKPDAELTNIIRKGISSAGMPGFGTLLDEAQIRAVLTYLRTLQRDEGHAPITGDAGRGRTLFFGVGRCAECHMLNGRGGFLAADLSGYGQAHSATAIREWILNPDKNFDTRHGTVTAVTRQGQQLRGVIRNEDNFSLQMQMPNGRFRLLEKSDLVLIQRETRSLMPNDYNNKLTAAQLDDVVAFLATAKGLQATLPSADEDQ